MLDVTLFVANDFCHSRDSPEMQFLLEEHYTNYLRHPGCFFYNANSQSPEDNVVQCLYFLEHTSFDLDIMPTLQYTIPVHFKRCKVLSNDLNTYIDLGLVVSTLELIF